MHIKNILVLLAAHNGETYIKTQIESILNQKNVNVSILCCDDNSSDNTSNILESYENTGKLKWFKGKFGSAQKNFYNLVNVADEFDYYAFADQDDYWKEDKLYTAISMLEEKNSEVPLLYYGVSTSADKDLIPYDQQYSHYPVLKFSESIVVSNAQGSTFVFNNKLKNLVKNKFTQTNMMHDSWLHKTCLAVGGEVVFDNNSYMLYRIHENNVFARQKTSAFKKIRNKFKELFSKNKYYILSNVAKEWLDNFNDNLTQESKKICNILINSKKICNRFKIFFGRRFKSKYKFDKYAFKILAIKGKL